MMLLLAGLLSLLNPFETTDTYQAVVVDARSRQPLASVRVEDLQLQVSSTTDRSGHFSLAGPVAHFRLRSLGFAVLEATRPALATGKVDTLRLQPEDVLLAEVSVRPAAVVSLSSLGTKVAPRNGVLAVPGQQFGVLFRPAVGVPLTILQQVSVRIQPGYCTAGRLQVRVVAPVPGSMNTPGERDLLPVTVVYTAAELAALPDHLLHVDLSGYGVRMPAAGLFVLVEGLATVAGEAYVKEYITGDERSKFGVPTIVTASDLHSPATFRETPVFNFPGIATAVSTTYTETVSRRGRQKPWAMMQLGNRAWDPGKNGKPGRVENVDITLTMRAE